MAARRHRDHTATSKNVKPSSPYDHPVGVRALLFIAACAAAAVYSTTAAASTAQVNGGVFTFGGSAGEANQVEFTQLDKAVTVIDSGAVIVAGSGCVQVTAHEVHCGRVRNRSVLLLADGDDTLSFKGATSPTGDVVRGGDGNDTIITQAGLRNFFVVDGDAGDDVITSDASKLVGGPGADTLNGGDSRNHLVGGTGNDTLRGGGGSDRLHPGLGDDVARGGPGGDWVKIRTLSSVVVIDLTSGRLTGQGTDMLFSISHASSEFEEAHLIGNGSRNVLVGRGVLEGRGGNDLLVGNGTLRGGPGNDGLRARNSHADIVRGGSGWDWARVDPRRDRVFGVQELR